MKLIFDCNVLVSALLANTSSSGQALLKAKSPSHTLLLSNPVLVELIDVLMRPKLDKYATKDIRQQFFFEYESICTKVKIIKTVNVCRDPKDDKYLELALSGNADYIISGDLDLLVLSPFEKIKIITPKDFLEQL